MASPFSRAFIVATMLLLAACAGPRSTGESAAGGENASNAASCTRACNRDHAACMDSRIAQGRERSQLRGDPSCDHQIRQCLAQCRAISAQ